MYETDYTTGNDAGASSTAKETAKQATGSAKQAAGEVTDTVKDQGRQVAGEVGSQARSVASDVRHSVVGQVRTGHDKLAETVRKLSHEVGSLSGSDTSSPVAQVVSRVSDTGHRAADYLERKGPEGLVQDVQSFARRKPGTFLLAAAAAGFVIGRLGRSTVAAARSDDATSGSTQGSQGLYAGGGYDATSTSAYGSTPTYDSTAAAGYGTVPTTGATFVEDTYATGSYDPAVDVAVGTAPVDPASDVTYDEAGYPVSVPQRGTSR